MNTIYFKTVNPEVVLEAVKNENVELKSVLTTHHHWDHAGGNEKLLSLFGKPLEVYGGDDRIGGLNKKINQDDTFTIGDLKVRCIFTPCHTSGKIDYICFLTEKNKFYFHFQIFQGHICYYIDSPNEKSVFTGDTLFLGGCGRFFEGTADQMYSALIEKLSTLPDETKVFCGHEYALGNLKFGNHVEPDNKDILDKIEWAKARRASSEPTVPSTIAEEKLINPFMRVNCETVQKFANTVGKPIETMAQIRTVKDSFK